MLVSNAQIKNVHRRVFDHLEDVLLGHLISCIVSITTILVRTSVGVNLHVISKTKSTGNNSQSVKATSIRCSESGRLS